MGFITLQGLDVGMTTAQYMSLCNAKYQELKENTKSLHIETGLPMPTDEHSRLPVAATRAMSTVLAHNLQPSPSSEGKQQLVIGSNGTFFGYPRCLHQEKEIRGCGDTCSNMLCS
ncbi:hypothetical protein M9H77_36880 [Catharanthus roseus]|uniref:Uncharacterized protein n=1 Tax=Catharanthus roseus TaxID=4058 RepID=A0ACB9ZWU1_CATRO|nr:hypothetical protein M9H77_36880 [Catharanthus roseus]